MVERHGDPYGREQLPVPPPEPPKSPYRRLALVVTVINCWLMITAGDIADMGGHQFLAAAILGCVAVGFCIVFWLLS